MAFESTAVITAIVPVYNGRRFLRTAVDSVLSQTHAPCELILVDDGSTDASCDEYAAGGRKSPIPIRVIRQTNGGQSAARNAAAAVAKGELLAFLDQDDIWYPEHLESLIRLMAQDARLGWVYSDLDEIDAGGLLVTRCFVGSLAAHPKTRLIDMVAGDMFVVPTATLLRRDAFLAVGGFDERLSGYEDDDLFLRMFREGYANQFLPEATAQWRIHSGSASTTRRMTFSRGIYARKLMKMFPDDRMRMRFFTRDLIAPRFLRTTIAGYLRALAAGDDELLRFNRDEARFLASHGDFRWRVRSGLALMSWPWLFRALLRVAKPDVYWRAGLSLEQRQQAPGLGPRDLRLPPARPSARS